LPETTTEAELLRQDKRLNSDDELDGYIVQLPFKAYRRAKILMAIDPNKDVDGFHPANFGKMALEMDVFYQQLLESCNY
jgi:methylenetetrahydrofolate dehydrogenase (NADP+)/methenyltetrahydrofolate cyclohydrolase